MKYKQGEKMIVEIAEVKENSYVLNRIGEVEPMETKIRRQAAEITRLLAENEKLKEEYNQAFNQGTEAAWELVRKIFDMEINDIEDIFIKEDAWDLGTVLNNYTYQEAAAKVAEWERQKEEIKAGDVFEFTSGGKAVVMKVYEDGEVALFFPDGGCGIYEPHESWHKTGRHIDIDSFLKQIGGNGNER